MSERTYYCFCDANCKAETMTKEQILAAIAQAVETGSVGDCDTGFITKVKETNAGGYVTFWVGTRAQYNALQDKAVNCIYIMTDDTTDEDMRAFVEEMQDSMARLEESVASRYQFLAKSVALAFDELNKCKGVDFSDNVRLTLATGANSGEITACYTDAVQYVYNPLLKAVFFRFTLIFTGAVQKGNVVQLVHSAKDNTAANYLPRANHNYPAATGTGRYFAEYNGDTVCIYVNEAIGEVETGGKYQFNVSGWYFCDEE